MNLCFSTDSKLGSKRRVPPRMHGARGVALVITLILLAVITTLAIAFLALTHRETGATDNMSRTTDAELSADSALERAKAEIIAGYQFRNSGITNAVPTPPDIIGPEMFVSVCCRNFEGNRTVLYRRLTPELRFHPTNIFDAGPPVFVDTNRLSQAAPRGRLDDRFFHDLNRNRIFDETGNVPNTLNPLIAADQPGDFEPELDAAGNPILSWRIGDPQWIGILQDPRRPHGANNRYIGRYAFMVLPAGRSLDVNWIHNDAKSLGAYPPGQSGFSRNQGVGGFEVNLAAFLTDLNTNVWANPNLPYSAAPYRFFTNNVPNTGTAFDDAWQILNARYGNAKAGLDRLSQILGTAPMPEVEGIIRNARIDVFANHRLLFPTDVSTWPWPGAETRPHLFTIHDFLKDNVIPRVGPPPGFTERVLNVSRFGNSYDRYTFYRLLSQLGTDSLPEDDEAEGRINLNYVNVAGIKASELIPWTDETVVRNRTGRTGPELFFLSVVTNLLQREFPKLHLVTNLVDQPLRIPVYTNGSRFWVSNAINRGPLYSARIHQILQQAANIYDAIRPLDASSGPMYPTVFRPLFATDLNNPGDVHIVNYELERRDPAQFMFINNDWVDLDLGQKPKLRDGVYNIPLIIGARSGYPNFNEFVSRTMAQAVRRLDIEKPVNETNLNNMIITETFNLFVTNQHSFEAWNSYSSNFPAARSLQLYYSNEVTVGIRTVVSNTPVVLPTIRLGTNLFPSAYVGNWRSNTFVTPPLAVQLARGWTNIARVDEGGLTNRWDVYVTNRVRFYLVDVTQSPGRIVDAVTLSLTNAFFDLGAELASDVTIAPRAALRKIWSRERQTGGRWNAGVQQQIDVSRFSGYTGTDDWRDFGDFIKSKEDAINNFNTFLSTRTNVVVTTQVPFTPVRTMIQANIWQVNDPLVHYTQDDLLLETNQATIRRSQIPNLNLGQLNPRYAPWGGRDINNPLPGEMDPSLRDPGLTRSDNWDFPTNKFPNIGWLGRVHRGTPWQTIYLKSPAGNAQNLATWRNHSGNARSLVNAESIHPTNDWRLLDIFTASIHPNTTRGRLSINQPGLAAWSAVLSGVTASTVVNTDIDGVNVPASTNTVIEPAVLSDAVLRIVQGINNNRNARPNRQFTRLGEILSVPELTYNSPLLTANGFNPLAPAGFIALTDADYEFIPQQILSLLKVGEPRFVVYAWGQSLKPARLGVPRRNDGSIDFNAELDGPSINPDDKVVNNYQVTGEVATRAVVRVAFPEKLREPDVNINHPNYGTPDYREPRVVVESFNVIPVD